MCRFLCRHKFPTPRTITSGLRRKWLCKNGTSTLVVPFCISPATDESSCCCTSLPSFGSVDVLDLGHSNRCAMVSCIYLQGPPGICGWAFVHMLIFNLCIFFSMGVYILSICTRVVPFVIIEVGFFSLFFICLFEITGV
jgi:hypothetical protein